MNVESNYRLAFVILLAGLFAIMYRVRRTGGRLTSDDRAIEREGSSHVNFCFGV